MVVAACGGGAAAVELLAGPSAGALLGAEIERGLRIHWVVVELLHAKSVQHTPSALTEEEAQVSQPSTCCCQYFAVHGKCWEILVWLVAIVK